MGGQAVGKVLLGAINDRSVHLGVLVGICAGAAGVTLMWLFPGTLALLLVGAFLFGVVYAMTTVQTPPRTRSERPTSVTLLVKPLSPPPPVMWMC